MSNSEWLCLFLSLKFRIQKGNFQVFYNSYNFSSEYFPEQYVVYRTDRCTTGGGVLLGIKTRLLSQQVVTQHDVELVKATFTVAKCLSALIGCCYRPPNTTEYYMHKVTAELRTTQQRHQEAMYLLGGDFNQPDIDWRDASVIGHQNPLAVNRGFLETFEDIGLTQIVDFPTHSNPDHTLDQHTITDTTK